MAAKIHMYSTPWCGYCAAAREFLNERELPFEDIDVSMNAELRQQMTELSGGTTVPQIFVNDKPIGGYDDMMALVAANKFDALVNSSTDANG